MKSLKLLIAFTCFTFCVKAQDSTKAINHEIGFNAVSLIKQLVSNSPGTTLNQLPYDVFYNLYFHDKIGIRTGLGISTEHTETTIEGQIAPRTSSSNTLNLRVGASYNFIKNKRLTLNVFGDFLTEKITATSANTQTVQNFPNPLQIQTITSTNDVNGTGFQAGVGVKFNIYKHLSLYTEMPLSFMVEKSTQKDVVDIDGGSSKTTTSTYKVSTTRITLPVTLYLVLRF